MRKYLVTIFLLFVLAFALHGQTTQYRKEITDWRAEHEAELKSEDAWLAVVGLFWLKDGKNTVGSGPGFDIELTDNFKPGKFGEIDFKNGKAALTVNPGVDARVNGNAIRQIDLVSDENSKQTIVKTGSQSFYLIKREKRYGIRLKDSNS